jgi:chloramphenicol 3-O phosphotransferase
MAHPGERQGRVIVLNGGSSAGKTTLARRLQSVLPGPWLLLGIDLFLWTLPPALINDAAGISVSDGVIIRGHVFMDLYAAFQRAVATVAAGGTDVLLDEVTLDGDVDQQRWNAALEDSESIWVGVRCAPDIAAGREAVRQTRLPGVARHQAVTVHCGVRYDVEVDTGVMDLAGEVGRVGEALHRRWGLPISLRPDEVSAPPPPSAWRPGESPRSPPWER